MVPLNRHDSREPYVIGHWPILICHSPSPRHPNHVLVGREPARVESLDGVRHRREKLDETAAVLPGLRVTESKVGTTDERAGRIERKRRDIRQELLPVVTLLKKILLDV